LKVYIKPLQDFHQYPMKRKPDSNLHKTSVYVGGLPLPKVLKNLTNMFFSITKTVTGGFGFEMKVCVI
jgi:hypothetical protein